MKIVILGDLHMGARSGDLDFARYFNRFFTDILFPYMESEGIDTIVQLGDYFDNQTSIDTTAWKECKPIWVDLLTEKDFKMFMLVGNHDIAFRNTLRVNTPELILSEFENIRVVSKPMPLFLGPDSYGFGIVPWICNENKEEVLKFIEKQSTPVLLGHFAIEGFPMYKGGMVDKKGLSRTLFENYPFVFSGHFHTKSKLGNIDYVGIPYEITWADYGDQKGFHVFDTDNQRVEFIHNPLTMFEKLIYDCGCSVDLLSLENKIVKMIVKDRGDLQTYNAFIDKLKSLKLKDLIIQEQVNDVSEVSETGLTEIDWVDNKTKYIEQAVDAIETDLDKEDIVSYLNGLHERSLAL